MAITIRDLKGGAAATGKADGGRAGAAAAAARPPIKRNIASLVGGVVIAAGCFVLWVLVASELTQWPPGIGVVAAGAAVALAIGIWIRVADL